MTYDWDKLVPEAQPNRDKASEAKKPADTPAPKKAPAPSKEWTPGTVPDAVRNARAVLRGQGAEKRPAPPAAKITAEIFPQTAAHNKDRALMATAKIGDMIGDKGIYAGIWQPADRTGQPLSQKFHVFAAPKDLVTNFNAAVRTLRDNGAWHRYKGLDQSVTDQTPDAVVYKALATGAYKGEWFVPPFELLKNNLYRYREEFNEAGAFDMAEKASYCYRYGSSTLGAEDPRTIQHLHFSDGSIGETHKSLYTLAIRPVRLEPVI